MFPLIPALILLLLHGPSSFDRLAEGGRLPNAFLAIHQDSTGAKLRAEVDREETSRRLLATLIAATGDRELSQAFHDMFLGAVVRPAGSHTTIFTGSANELPRASIPPTPVISEGYQTCERSRDGPDGIVFSA